MPAAGHCGKMDLHFTDFSAVLRSPPKLQDLIGETKDARRQGNDLLIIIPSYHDHYRLRKQLARLRGQKFQKFDIAIILASDDKFISTRGLSICQMKRKADYGFAGAVYAGQLFALSYGYKYYIFTDVDKVPHTSDSLGILYRSAERTGADFVFGNNLIKGYFFQSAGFFNFSNPHAVKSNCVFSLIRTSTLEKTGLYALPLYIGYEDVEFECRLRKSIRSSAHVDSIIYESYNSPAKSPFLASFGADAMGHMYVYPTLLCIYNSPQTASHIGLSRQARMFFSVLLSQKFSALRIPELLQYEKNASTCLPAKTSGQGVSQEISKTLLVGKIGQDYKNYTSNATLFNSLRILRAALTHSRDYRTSNYSPLFDFFIHDSFIVHDEKTSRDFLFEWKRKPPAPTKLLALLSALFDTAAALLKSAYFDAIGNVGIFQKYGARRH